MIDYLINLGWNRDIAVFVASAGGVIAVATFPLLWIIFSIWLERKVAGRIQDRVGPNRTGPFGLFQSFADLGKLLTKEDITPDGADRPVYNIAPLLSVASAVLTWAVIPFARDLIGADLNIGVLYFAAVGSLGTVAIMLAGWSSNNKYALLGAFRVTAQLISYEIPMVLAILVPVLLAGTMGMQGIVEGQNIWYVFVAPISAFIFFTSSLAEAGRSPFDLIEAESELVAGYNTEYSGMKFGMFMAAEFMHAFTISVLTSILFLGGWRGPGATIEGPVGAVLGVAYLGIKSMLVYFLVMLIRNTVPRIRIDQMMAFNWKFLVPLSLVNILVVAFFAKLFQVDYGWHDNFALGATGIGGFIYSVFGPRVMAELPRAIILLLANLGVWWALSALLNRYAHLERRKVIDLVTEPPQFSPKEAPASAGD
ncbi:MAG: NADH-quinone oxidoreductase subunit NuoH [Anaerolineae bacterium]|nr:NADH-quinone oxidoreductase subunit NuoH [Anaerolineae bacterium]